MHFNSMVVIYTFILPLVSAGCYTGGQKATNLPFALDNVGAVAIQLQGNYVAYQSRAVCLTDSGSGSNWYFSVENNEGKARTIAKGDIEKFLKLEITGCKDYGGSSEHGKIQYTSDSNNGVCTDTKYINNHEPKPKPPTRRGAVIQRASVPLITDVSELGSPRPVVHGSKESTVESV